MPTVGIDDVGKAQTFIERGPLTFFLAVFVLAFFLLLWWHIKETRRQAAAELLSEKEHTKQLVAILTAVKQARPSRRQLEATDVAAAKEEG